MSERGGCASFSPPLPRRAWCEVAGGAPEPEVVQLGVVTAKLHLPHRRSPAQRVITREVIAVKLRIPAKTAARAAVATGVLAGVVATTAAVTIAVTDNSSNTPSPTSGHPRGETRPHVRKWHPGTQHDRWGEHRRRGPGEVRPPWRDPGPGGWGERRSGGTSRVEDQREQEQHPRGART